MAKPIRETAEHPVPRDSASWFYVFGSAALTTFGLQLVTGILLATVYVPSAGEAWNSLQVLNHDIALGWFIRALHGWGSNFMVAIVLIHMVQVFLFGAYKYPRELTWMLGVLLLLVTLGMAFTGQVMRFDQDAYWGLGIGASIASRVPFVGPWLVNLLLGGPIIAGATLSRFFAMHVFVIPGLLIGFVCLHVLLVLKLGSTNGRCPVASFGAPPTCGNITADPHGRCAVRSVRGVEGHSVLRLRSALDCRLRRLLWSLRSGRTSRIQRLFRQRRVRISSSCGFTPCCRSCHRQPKRRYS